MKQRTAALWAFSILLVWLGARFLFPVQPEAALWLAVGGYFLAFQFLNRHTHQAGGFFLFLLMGYFSGKLAATLAGDVYPFLLAGTLAALVPVLRLAFFRQLGHMKYLWLEVPFTLAAFGCYFWGWYQLPVFHWQVLVPLALVVGFAGSWQFSIFRNAWAFNRQARHGYGVNVGDPAPEIELPDQHGLPFRLSDHVGQRPVLLMFVRGDWCPFCHMMLVSYKREQQRFAEKNILLVAIGPDPIGVNLAMAQRMELDFHVLSDPTLSVTSRYGVQAENPLLPPIGEVPKHGIPLPASFLIDSKGIVRYTSRPEQPGEFLDPNTIFPVLEKVS